MANMTTFRSDYVPHPVIPRKARPQSAYVPPEGDMRTTTTYSENFQRHAMHARRHRPAMAQEYQPSTAAKMDVLSTYKDDFRTWPLQRRQPYRLVDNLTLNTGSFCATSTFKDDFRPVSGTVMRQSCKPPAHSVDRRESTPFCATSHYRLQYIPHPPEALQRPSSAPVRAGSSAQRSQSQNRPTPAFQSTTEFRDKYQAWPLAARRQRQAEGYVAPSGDMDFHSTTHVDYVRHECPGSLRRLRPAVQAWGAENQAGAHPGPPSRGRPAERRVQGKQHNAGASPNPSPTSTVATATTTYQSQFTPKTAPKPGHYKPPQARKPGSDGGYDPEGNTRRACTPTPQGHPPCPASLARPPGFQDTHTTTGGHRLYRTLSGAEDGPAKAVAMVSGSQSQPHRGQSAGRASGAVDGRGRGQH